MAKVIGQSSLVSGCRTKPRLVAVVQDPNGDARDLAGEASLRLNGATDFLTAGRLKAREAGSAPPEAGALPPGQIFVGEVKLKTSGMGTLRFDLTAEDQAGNLSEPYSFEVPVVANMAATIDNVSLSGEVFTLGERSVLTVMADMADDCGIRKASVEIDSGRGFRSVGSLDDRGRKGDVQAGDGVWGGTAKIGLKEAGIFPLQIHVEDLHREHSFAGPFNITIQNPGGGTAGRVTGTISSSEANFVDTDVNDPFSPRTFNDNIANAQEIPTPATCGGYVNIPGYGPPGASLQVGDQADFYRVSLTAGNRVSLHLGDDPALTDLDLCLYDAGGAMIDCSLGIGDVEELVAPSSGTFYVEVFPYSNCQCGSNYNLVIGQAFPVLETRSMRLTDEFVPGEVIVTLRGKSLLSAEAQNATPERYASRFQMKGIAGNVSREMLLALGTEAEQAETFRALGSDAGRGRMQERYKDLPVDKKLVIDTIHVVKELRRRSDVATADLNYIVRPLFVPNDGFYNLQWHYPIIGLPQAWDVTTGANSVIAAVIDTGVLLSHPDLQGQLVPGYDFISDKGMSADGDGIDPNPDDPGDGGKGGASSFHGTHVAGTVAAASNNNIGVAGVAPGARIMPVRVLGVGGGTNYDVLQGVRFAAGMANDSGTIPPQPADVINLSLGGGSFSQTAQNVYSAARNAGVIVVAAAGNDSNSAPNYPSSYDGVVSVSGLDLNKNLAYYSNFGSTVDVAGPGGDVRFDLNGDGYFDGVLSTGGRDDGSFTYTFYQGTSMATPHVAGVAALMKSVAPAMTPAQFDNLLGSGAITEDLGALGRDDFFGHGLINAYAAVIAAQGLGGPPPPPPPAVLVVNPTALNFGATLSETVITLANGTGGSLTVSDVSEDSGGWLSVNALEVDGNGLGTYRVTVNRGGLFTGTFSANISVTSTANPVSVPVIMNVGGATVSNVGFHFVILVRPDTQTTIDQFNVAPVNGTYPYEFTDVQPGEYLIFAGTDHDNDGFICDGGEACGAFPTLDFPSPVTVNGDLSNLDFNSGFSLLIGVGSAGLDGVPTKPRRGFELLHPKIKVIE